MHITWHGLSCIKLQTTDAIVLVNPYQDSVGLSMPKLKTDIVATTNMDNDECNNIDRLQGEYTLVSNPGEYEIKNVFIYGIPGHQKQTLYVFEAEGIKCAHLGSTLTTLSDAQLAHMEGIDVLFLPINGSNSGLRSDIISAIEPRVIIPVQYATPKVKVKLDSLDSFAKDMGIKASGGEKKIILKAKDLPVDETQTIILQPV